MATRVRTRLTVAEGRRFGLTVGTAFLAFAVLAWWKGRLSVAEILGIVGGFFVVGAAIVPTRLGPVERAWMALAHAISRVTTPIIMAILYFAVITPVALIRRVFAGNPIVQRQTETGYWKTRTNSRSSNLERQF